MQQQHDLADAMREFNANIRPRPVWLNGNWPNLDNNAPQ
jgi:hypothetical protein